MAQKESGWCTPDALLGFIMTALVIFGIAITHKNNPSHGPLRDVPLDVCNLIKEDGPFMRRIKNVTVLSGSVARIDCRVMNYGQLDNERIFWTGPAFDGGGPIEFITSYGLTIKVLQTQKGVNVSGEWNMDIFKCDVGDVMKGLAPWLNLDTFTLVLNPVQSQHAGWYSCISNFTRTGGSGILERKFYLSVVKPIADYEQEKDALN